ncbi:MAG: DNA-directed RNA polymerase subunit beta, partial [Candidatus Omnitrophica bacterium]|nr:DNA-directed RNA polymerase subunit beta [Candidatus Omnitrophota bacterium]
MERKNFARILESVEIPNLVEVQTESFEDFLQTNVSKNNRKNQGLQAVLSEIFPIESSDRRCRLEFTGYSLEKPKYDVRECKKRGQTYAGVLKVMLRLVTEKDTKEQEVYLGEIPIMTETGTFIVNGDERVVVSQLHRSPGICFEESVHPNGKKIYSARIIPYRGTWIEFEFDIYDVLYAYLDRRRKVLVSTLLRSIGYSRDEDILNLFCGTEDVNLQDAVNAKGIIGRISAAEYAESGKGDIIAARGAKLSRES